MASEESHREAPLKAVSLLAIGRNLPQTLRAFKHVPSFLSLLHIYIGAKTGLFGLLATGSSLEDLVKGHGFDQELLSVWLKIAESDGLVRGVANKYVLTKKGSVFSPDSPTYAGVFSIVLVDYWAEAFRKIPELMESGHRLVLEGRDLDALVAHLSRSLEPLSFRVLQKLPQAKKRGSRALDVGCGLGSYLIFLAKANPTLEGVGIELAEDVAAAAKDAVKDEGLSERVKIVTGDIREVSPDGAFDICIFSQVYYYLSPEERVHVLTKLSGHLAPGGALALLVPVLSENWKSKSEFSTKFFHFFQKAHKNMYGIPTKQDVHEVLKRAGLTNVKTYPLFILGGPYYYFIGSQPSRPESV